MSDANSNDLWPIGQFALATGLSVSALRHYDTVGLLRPARVDPGTGYRYYHPDQVETAEVVRRLRRIGVPVEEVATALAADGVALRDLLRGHRVRLTREADAIAERVERIDRYIRDGLLTRADTIGFHKIVPTFPVRDVNASVRFYVDGLGFTLGGREGDDFASVFRGRVADVNIYLNRQDGPSGTAECYVFVEDPDALHAEYAREQVPVVHTPRDTPWGYRQFTISDPDGHRLHLFRFLEAAGEAQDDT